MRKETSNTPSQSAGKALALLRQVGAHHPQGVRLTQLIALTGLDRSTAHRLLGCLVDEGFVERAGDSKLYRLGIEAMQLGLLSAGLQPVVERFRPVMQRIARQSGDTVFLIVRSGDHALCLHREEGSYPVKAFVIEPGSRRLLGISSVGVGILARLPDAEVDAAHAAHATEYARHGLGLERLRSLVRQTRRDGFAEMDDFQAGVASGVGCAFRLSSGSYAGISVAAINARMPAPRRRELGQRLREAVQPFEWRDGGSLQPGPAPSSP